MFDRSNKDLISAGLVSALGAGIVTSFAVNQGQDPFVALMITRSPVFVVWCVTSLI